MEADWCIKFTTMTDRYREIRSKSQHPMTSCFWCKRPFANGEDIWLACFKKRGNEAMCEKCAKDLRGENE